MTETCSLILPIRGFRKALYVSELYHGRHPQFSPKKCHAAHSSPHTLLSRGERSTGVPEFGPASALEPMRMRGSFSTSPTLGRRMPASEGTATT